MYSRAVIALASAVTLVSGLVLVAQMDVTWSTLWVALGREALGLGGLVLSLALVRR